jgi:hypothetical protein
MVIDAELDREDHNSIPATAIGRGLKPYHLFLNCSLSIQLWKQVFKSLNVDFITFEE